MNRNLDNVFFRVKRSNKFENICFSDLTKEERDEICKDRNKEWFQQMLYIIADRLKLVGDTFGIVGEDE